MNDYNLAELKAEGYDFDQSVETHEDGSFETVLTYMGRYEHVSATVYPARNVFKLSIECVDGDGTISWYQFNGKHSGNDDLEAIATGVQAIDTGIEGGLVRIDNMDILTLSGKPTDFPVK